MKLNYNIYFEVSAALFMMVLAYFVRWQYNMTTSKNKSFFRMLLFLIASDIMDVVTAITISNIDIVPYYINMVLNLIYFVLLILLSAQFLDYSFELTERKKWYSKFKKFEYIYVCVFTLLLIVNLFTGIIYDLQNGKYIHGPIYIVVYIGPYLLLVMSAVVMFRYVGKWERIRRCSVVLYYIVSISGVLLQLLFFPNVLLNLFTISLSVVIILFAMETQDYQALVKTVDEMNMLNEKAKVAIETKRRFVNNISFNVRMPVKRIIEIDESLLGTIEDEETQNLIRENLSYGLELLGALDYILEYSEAELNDIEIVEEEYNIKDAIDSWVISVSRQAEEKNIYLNVEIDSTLPRKLYGDRDHITQIVRELVTNAIRFTDEGGVTIKVTWKDYDKRHILLLISVEDTGMGIPKEVQNNVFESFETGQGGTDFGERRIGLGLAFAKKLVEFMNGDIGFYSKEGEGTLFYVEFPQKIDVD